MNPWLLVLETNALPTELFSLFEFMLKYLIEIQNKFILLTTTLFSIFFVCYYYKDVLLFLVTQMHLNDKNSYFIFTDVTELFSVYFRLIRFLVTQTVAWYMIYHVFSFIRPALYFQEFKIVNFLFLGTTLFSLVAVFFSSYILIPFGWSFFLSFQSHQKFYFEARISEYFNFYTNIYFLALTYCQLFTLLFVFLTDIKHNYVYIKKYRKLYYYLFLVFSTMVTPPDLFSQLFTTLLLIVLYEVTLLFVMFHFFLPN